MQRVVCVAFLLFLESDPEGGQSSLDEMSALGAADDAGIARGAVLMCVGVSDCLCRGFGIAFIDENDRRIRHLTNGRRGFR